MIPVNFAIVAFQLMQILNRDGKVWEKTQKHSGKLFFYPPDDFKKNKQKNISDRKNWEI